MKTRRSPRRAFLWATSLLAVAFSAPLYAVDGNWTGNDSNDYLTPGNWSGGQVPTTNSGGTATIGSGTAVYTPGGDLTVSGGPGTPGRLNITGGSFEQVVGGAWMKIGDGAGNFGELNISNGSFNAGTSLNLWLGFNSSTGTLNMTGGSFQVNNTLELTSLGVANFNGGVVTLSGPVTNNGIINIGGSTVTRTGNFGGGNQLNLYSGTLNITGELQPVGTMTIYGGILNTALLAFQGDGTNLTLAGGRINSSGTYDGGIFSANGSYLDFTGAAELYLSNIVDVNPLFSAGKIRLNGAMTDASAFTLTSEGSGTLITYVPEPSPLLAGMIGLGGLALLRRRKPSRQV